MVGRPKKHPRFERPGFRQQIRTKFLRFALSHNAPALRLLCTEVRLDKMSLHKWAQSFNISGTWVEQWADDTLDSWRTFALPDKTDGSPKPWYILSPPDPLPPGMRPKRRDGRIACRPPIALESDKLDVEYPLPRASEVDAPIANSSAPWTQTEALFENDGTTIGGAPGLNIDPCPHCGRKAIGKRRKRYKRLDEETALLDSKIECAAVYLLCRASIDELAKKRHASPSAMYGWLKEAMALLDLKMRPHGHLPILK